MKNILEILREYTEEKENPTLVLKKNVKISESLNYHIENSLSLTNNIYRVYSTGYFNLVIELNEEDTLMVESDLGKAIIIEGQEVYLDAPFLVDEDEVLEEAKHRGKNVKLGKPFRTPGGPKKFAVYVKTPGGGVKKVTFGDPNLRVRNSNKGAAKSFRARHKCDQKKDRTTAGYWSCNVGRYAKQLGLSSGNSW